MLPATEQQDMTTETRSKIFKRVRSFAAIFISAILLVIALLYTGAQDVVQDLGRFPWWIVLGVTGLLGLNLVLVSYRLGRVLSHFGMVLPVRLIAKASISGYAASLFFISLFGQVAGRHMVLRHSGVSSVLLAILTAYERFVLLIISGSLSLAGAAVILDKAIITKFLADISLPEIVVAAVGGIVLSFWLGRSRFEVHLLSRTRTFANIMNVMEIGSITLFGQLLVFSAFVLAVLTLQPEIDIWKLMAAVAITSFAASLPLTVNGWGVRELAAVYTLGQIGVSSSNALAVSILIGLSSTAVILIAVPFALKMRVDRKVMRPHSNTKVEVLGFEIEKAAAWLIVTATAVLIFFQIRVTLAGGVINLNLADPFAILALAATVLHAVSARQLPNWRVIQFNKLLAVFSLLLVFAFINGALEIGVTQWALAGRLFGWLVLLGYLSVGYLTVSYLGLHGLRRLSETIVSTAVVVIVVQISLRMLDNSGWLSDLRITQNFEGFAGNRNAFAFQMLVSSILLLAYSTLYKRVDRFEMNRLSATCIKSQLLKIPLLNRKEVGTRILLISFLHGFILASLALSASRTGLIAVTVLLGMAWVGKLAEHRFILLSLVFAVLIWYLPQLVNSLWSYGSFSEGASNTERWASITRGITMWLESPLIGSGLGVFIERSTEWFDDPMVIHNTPVWILAEFGLLGAGVFLGILASLIHLLYKNGLVLPAYRILAMLLVVFILFSLAHEIFYQRIFWLILGAVIATSAYNKNKDKQVTVTDCKD